MSYRRFVLFLLSVLLFAGRTDFDPAADFRERVCAPGQRLVRVGILHDLGTFTAKRHIVRRRRGETASPLAAPAGP